MSEFKKYRNRNNPAEVVEAIQKPADVNLRTQIKEGLDSYNRGIFSCTSITHWYIKGGVGPITGMTDRKFKKMYEEIKE